MAKRRAVDPVFAAKQRAKWKEQAAKRRDYHLAYCREYNQGYYEDHRDKLLDYARRYAESHREMVRELKNRYAKSEKGRKNARENRRDYIAALTDAIVRSYLRNKHNWAGIDIPQQVVETKRKQLELKREIRKWQSTT